MKKTIKTLFLLSFTALSINAQNVFPTSSGSNVGIGTTTPSSRLQITSSTFGTSGLRFTNLTSTTTNSTSNGKALTVDTAGNVVLTPILNPNPSQFFINATNGNIGIGTNIPSDKLDVKGELSAIGGSFVSKLANGIVSPNTNPGIRVLSAGGIVDANGTKTFNFFDCPNSNLGDAAWVWFNIQNRNDVARFQFRAIQDSETELNIFNKSQSSVFSVYNDGNDNVKVTLPKADSYLGIGTTSFTDGVDTYRLSVKGNIRAERVKVYTAWADFVFEKNYNLPTLEEVEKHIIQNGHLKDIPSAKVVEKNGIELGEMNKLLLQKVEELTLYLIDLNKEIKELKNQIKN